MRLQPWRASAVLWMVMVATSWSRGGADDVVVSLEAEPLSVDEIKDLSHPSLAPKVARLQTVTLGRERGSKLDIPAEALVAAIPLRGASVPVYVWEAGGKYEYALVVANDAGETKVERRTAAWPEYVTWTVPTSGGSAATNVAVQAGGGGPPKWVRYLVPEYREGVWEVDGQRRRLALLDTDQDGDYADVETTRLLIDLDGDGEFRLANPTLENLDASGAYSLGAFSFRAAASADGRELRLLETAEATVQLNPFEVGELAPDFAAVNFDGDGVRLRDLRGKFVFLDIWATWCGPCIAEMPNVKAAAEKYRDDNIVFVGVSIDATREAAEQFAAARELDYVQLWAPGEFQSDICRQFQVTGIPATFLIDPEGVLVATGLRGDALEETVRHVPEYETAAGKAYFASTVQYNRLAREVQDLMRDDRHADALERVREYLAEYPELTEDAKFRQLKRAVLSEL